MAARALMFQGTGSDVGKSLVVAGLCRVLARKGLRVAPFKAQNMSNNAAVTEDGGEIGRAQWLQALAAGIAPSVHMNPVLVKPQSDRTSQIIVRGKVEATMAAADYHHYRAGLMPRILESYHTLAKDADIILVEGAGSPAEINLRKNDIANMGFARAADCPVILIGDIDRGGVIASIVGTHTVLEDDDKAMICGFLINKFRGDPALFEEGAKAIERLTGWHNLGLLPHHAPLGQLPQEDSMALNQVKKNNAGTIHIVILSYPHIANFDDIDPLAGEPGVKLTWCKTGDVIPGDANLVILPGSKSTIADLAFLCAQGWDIDLKAHIRRGGRVMGICGGYQMLGKQLSDPHGIEGAPTAVDGLGLLDISTVFVHEKTVTPWQEKYKGEVISGYEIHAGVSEGADRTRPLFEAEGAQSVDGTIRGTYIHGLFANDHFRKTLLQELGGSESSYNYHSHIQTILDGWADVIEGTISVDLLMSLSKTIAT